VRVNANHRVLLFMRVRDHADHERESDMELGGSPMASRCLSRWIDHLLERKGENAKDPEEGGHEISALLRPNACDSGLQDAGEYADQRE
jgi:hypothetical protein